MMHYYYLLLAKAAAFTSTRRPGGYKLEGCLMQPCLRYNTHKYHTTITSTIMDDVNFLKFSMVVMTNYLYSFVKIHHLLDDGSCYYVFLEWALSSKKYSSVLLLSIIFFIALLTTNATSRGTVDDVTRT